MNRISYYADFLTMPFLVAYLVMFCDVYLPLTVVGFGIWTIAEYVIHRVLFHRLPLFKPAHDDHHARPFARTGVTSWHSLGVFGGLFLVLPASILAGIALGYLAYISAHHAVHHWTIAPGHPLYALKLRHIRHHKGDEVNFGVVTTLWDRLLGTHRA